MSEVGAILVESTTRMFSDLCTRERLNAAERGEWPAEIWDASVAMGLDQAAVSEVRGGAGLDVKDLCLLLRMSGQLSVPIPLAETWLSEHLLAAAGLPVLQVSSRPATVAPVISTDRLQLSRTAGGWSLTGKAHRVPWGRAAGAFVLLAESADGIRTVAVEADLIVGEARNYAGEPRDTLEFIGVPVADEAVGEAGRGYTFDDLLFDGALMRGSQMVGAMERILELTVQYAKERVQFGRPIGKFQAVQQQIAVLAGQVAAASAAAHGAADARAAGSARFEIGCAKVRIGEAAGQVAAIAHQVHGAMGFTHEHTLHYSTRRLWSWRDEFGSETEWAGWVGRTVGQIGGERLWSFIVDPRDPATALELW